MGPLQPRLLDLAGAAAYLGISTWTIREWAAAGVLHRVKLPGGHHNHTTGVLQRVLFDRLDLDRLIERSKEP